MPDDDFSEDFSQAKAPEDIAYTVPQEDIRREGDFYVESISLVAYNGKAYDLTMQRVRLSIYSDIFSHVMSGTIELQDSVDLPQLLPIIGEETLNIIFTRPSESGRGLLRERFKESFRVYKMTDRRKVNNKDNVLAYTLHFVKSEMIKGLRQKVSRSFSEMLISDMVQIIYDEYIKIKKPIFIEPTMFLHNLVVPNWTPMQAIALLSARAVSENGAMSSYVFYEDDEKYNFTTLTHLMSQPASQKYIHQIGNILDSQNNDRLIEQDVRRIESYNFSGNFDVINNLSQGMYANRLLTIDPLRQHFETIDFDVNEEFDEMPHLEKHKSWTDSLDALASPEAYFQMAITTKDHDTIPHIVTKEPGILPNRVENWMQLRRSLLQQLHDTRIICEASGDPRRRAGQVVEFAVPNSYGQYNADHQPNPPFERYLAGRYLITAFKHRIDGNKYYNEFELVKDSLLSKIKHVDPIKDSYWTF